ncbi:MAG TPA: carbamoyltransferase C-terminal domain-containing protein, partial [Thermoanaerobaculia bacterium]
LGPARRPDEELEQRHKDLAASLQLVYEERFFALVRALQRRTGLDRLTLAGGCAMNSLANGRLFQETDVREVYIQAAAGDAGTALGAALYVQHAVLGAPRHFVMEHAYWGPAYGNEEIRAALAAALPGSEGRDGAWPRDGETLRVATAPSEDRLAEETADALVRGDVVGWYQGRSEWGPRALGNRSILADPRRPDVRDLLNRKIKRREMFRPFAPSILEERTGEWFTIDYPDPFMIKVYPIREEKRSAIPAVTHADGTGRLQTVSAATNPRYWRLIRAFEERTGVPIVLNTSFNESEPIVNRPEEALDCFLRTRMDRLVLGDRVVTREG